MKIANCSFQFISLALFLLAIPQLATAQGARENLAKARATLNAIDKLIDSIQSRTIAPKQSANLPEAAWQDLFDGKTLKGWKKTEFAGGGGVTVEPSFRGGPAALVVHFGSTLSGINYTGSTPKTNYEISLEAMKVDGSDFMCGLTFPVGDSHASLILGGWGGGVVGISSIDGHDASENETTQYLSFPKDKWFKVRMRVTPEKLETWLDEKKIIDQVITGKKINLRFGEISLSTPIGISTFQTTAAYRNIRIRPIVQ